MALSTASAAQGIESVTVLVSRFPSPYRLNATYTFPRSAQHLHPFGMAVWRR